MLVTSSRDKNVATVAFILRKVKLTSEQKQLVTDLVQFLPTVPNFQKDYSPQQIIDWLVTPILANQYFVIYNNGKLVAFLTYAFLDKQTENKWLTKKTSLTIDEWRSGTTPWLIDCLAPHGHARKISMTMVEHLRKTGHKGKRIHFRRIYKSKEIRYSSSLL